MTVLMDRKQQQRVVEETEPSLPDVDGDVASFVRDYVGQLAQSASPTSTHLLLEYPSSAPQLFCTLYHEQHEIPSIKLLHAANASQLNEDALVQALKQFIRQASSVLDNAPELVITAESSMTAELSPLLSTLLPAFTPSTSSHVHYFTATDGQLDRLRKVDVPAMLPYGFTFGEPRPEDAAHIAAGSEGTLSEAAVRQRLVAPPSSVIIRDAASDACVSHELWSAAEGLTHLFTHTDYRRRGLATRAEMQLAKAVASANFRPFKAVPVANQSAYRSNNESPFWSVVNREGIPVDFTIMRLTRA